MRRFDFVLRNFSEGGFRHAPHNFLEQKSFYIHMANEQDEIDSNAKSISELILGLTAPLSERVKRPRQQTPREKIIEEEIQDEQAIINSTKEAVNELSQGPLPTLKPGEAEHHLKITTEPHTKDITRLEAEQKIQDIANAPTSRREFLGDMINLGGAIIASGIDRETPQPQPKITRDTDLREVDQRGENKPVGQ